MRYIGGKTLLLDEIHSCIREVAPDAKSVIDLFAGSGCVTKYLKQKNYDVICNDNMYFSYVLLRGTAQLKSVPVFCNLGVTDPIAYLNTLSFEQSGINIEDCFIYQNYAPHDACERMYFTTANALKIDMVRQKIEQWKHCGLLNDDEYFYLLASLISAVPYVSNIAGVYAAYLKHWDARALKPLTLKSPEISPSLRATTAYNSDFNVLLNQQEADVLYSDSPYNAREYLPNYHILETIARYDSPKIKGVSGMRNYDAQKSLFCSKQTVCAAFEHMIRRANVKYVVISYNTEGLISTGDLVSICTKYADEGGVKLKGIPYRRYKSKKPNNEDGLMELLYSFKKKESPYVKSPFNYIGGKYKLLPQIERLFPVRVNKMVDLFCGGCDVAVNAIAREVYANDINHHVVDILKTMQGYSTNELIAKIENTIKKWGLTKSDKEAYLRFRKHYNETRDPISLYVLVCYSFNYQFRFNAAHEYNNPFGKDRSSFSDAMKANLIVFHKRIKNIHFSSLNFKDFDISHLGTNDFIYADPPYLITTGSYNDGKRGFEGWSEADDKALFAMLDKAHQRGVRFAMSNVIEHKGVTNLHLADWAQNYHIHHLNYNYDNSNYQSRNRNTKTSEVLITNY